MTQLKELKERRAAIHAQAVEELKKPQTVETRAKVDAMFVDIEAIGTDIARIERADKIASELAITLPVNKGGENRSADELKAEKEKLAAEYRTAWQEWMLKGDPQSRFCNHGGAKAEQVAKLKEIRSKIDLAETREQRDQIAGTQSITYTQGTVGGFFVPAGFVYDVEKATRFYAPLLDGSTIRVLETATGQVLPYPTSNDTNQAWTLVGEATQVSDTGSTSGNATYSGGSGGINGQLSGISGQPGNVLLGRVNFNAYKGTTGLIRVSLELLQDSAFNLEAFLTDAFAVRLGRGYEFYLTNGSGSNAPLGILPAIAASGAVPVVAQGSSSNDGSSNTGVNSIGYIDLVNLIHSIDPTYRRGAKFMLHDQTLRFLKTLLDKFGRPLWVPGVKESEPDTLAGYQYVINQSFPTIAASASTVAFGAWQKFICRKVRDLQVLRLDERFADFGEVAYVGFSRIDSNLVDAGTHPINVLQQHS